MIQFSQSSTSANTLLQHGRYEASQTIPLLKLGTRAIPIPGTVSVGRNASISEQEMDIQNNRLFSNGLSR